MNSSSWNVGHLAWQEQRYWLGFGQGTVVRPEVQEFATGKPASVPYTEDVWSAWNDIINESKPWLNRLTTAELVKSIVHNGREMPFTFGNLILRTIYHYW